MALREKDSSEGVIQMSAIRGVEALKLLSTEPKLFNICGLGVAGSNPIAGAVFCIEQNTLYALIKCPDVTVTILIRMKSGRKFHQIVFLTIVMVKIFMQYTPPQFCKQASR